MGRHVYVGVCMQEGVSSNLAFLGMHFVLFAALLLLVDMRVEIGAFFKRTCGGRSRGGVR